MRDYYVVPGGGEGKFFRAQKNPSLKKGKGFNAISVSYASVSKGTIET